MDPFLGEIMLNGYSFPVRGWAFCNGQLLPIAQNTALFSILGTTYGGNGQTTFALPDLRGRIPVHFGQGPGLSPYDLGESSGVENVTLTVAQLPAHNHPVQVNNGDGSLDTPIGNFFAGPGADRDLYLYNAANTGGNAQLNALALNPTGSAQPHPNIMPYNTISFSIALEGVFPSRN